VQKPLTETAELDPNWIGGIGLGLERSRTCPKAKSVSLRAASFSARPAYGQRLPRLFADAGWRCAIVPAVGAVEVGHIGKAGVERDGLDCPGGSAGVHKQAMRSGKLLFEQELRERSARRT
jgi:hypothetical protein